MSSLYELTGAYEEILNLLYDGETDDNLVFDTIESIEDEVEAKADNYAKIIKDLSGTAKMIREEEERLYARRHSLESRAQHLKDMLQANLEFMGKTKFKTDLFSFNVQVNGGKQPLTITENLGEIPGKYLIPQPPKVDMDAVRLLLEQKEVDWAKLEPRSRTLRIR